MNKKKAAHNLQDQGFTLIEVIITLVVLAIVASMLVTAMEPSIATIDKSTGSTPISRLQQTMALQQTMENIRANFDDTNDLAALNTAVGAGMQNNSFGAYKVEENKYINFSSYGEVAGIATDGILKVTIKDPASGLILTELFVSW